MTYFNYVWIRQVDMKYLFTIENIQLLKLFQNNSMVHQLQSRGRGAFETIAKKKKRTC